MLLILPARTKSSQARSQPKLGQTPPGLFDHIEIRWTDWNYLMSHQDDGQSDWNSFVQDHMCPPEPADLEPEYEPHETYNFGGDDEREPLTRTLGAAA